VSSRGLNRACATAYAVNPPYYVATMIQTPDERASGPASERAAVAQAACRGRCWPGCESLAAGSDAQSSARILL